MAQKNSVKVTSANNKGYNFSSIGIKNRLLVLKMIMLDGPISRTELAAKIGLTKTTLGNIVSDLIKQDLVSEIDSRGTLGPSTLGRTPVLLEVSQNSPCVCGILIKRKLISGIISDLSGKTFEKESYIYEDSIDAEALVDMIVSVYEKLVQKSSRKILAVSISCIGPIDDTKRMILNPPNFYGIKNLSLCDIMEKRLGLPCYMINDANAGALAEKMYGNGKIIKNFMYLHIMNGIGSGYILDHNLYRGEIGQCGEIGHSSINYSGPLCDCGNVGCLELYANVENMNQKIQRMRECYGVQTQIFRQQRRYSFVEILRGANAGDMCAISALDEFCGYIAVALWNAIKLFNINNIIVGYDGDLSENVIEHALAGAINQRFFSAADSNLSIEHSTFGGDAPLYGAIAHVANLVFEGKIDWLEKTEK